MIKKIKRKLKKIFKPRSGSFAHWKYYGWNRVDGFPNSATSFDTLHSKLLVNIVNWTPAGLHIDVKVEGFFASKDSEKTIWLRIKERG